MLPALRASEFPQGAHHFDTSGLTLGERCVELHGFSLHFCE
jgi:hypothetical protein